MESEADRLRHCLRIIRDLSTMPNDVLPNGKTAAQTAHEYVMTGKQKRGQYKKARTSPNKRRARRKKPSGTNPKKQQNVSETD